MQEKEQFIGKFGRGDVENISNTNISKRVEKLLFREKIECNYRK
jgi:hypothetical protein